MTRLLTSIALGVGGLLLSPALTSASVPAQNSSAEQAAYLRTISGRVGPDATISMSRLRTRSGWYVVTIRDYSGQHNFHLIGTEVDKRTGVLWKGTVRWKVRLFPGTYVFRCDQHRTQMRGTLRVIRA